MVLAQQGVDDKTNELGVIEEFLLRLALQGRVVTTDALLTQHTVAAQIVEQQGDYVLPVITSLTPHQASPAGLLAFTRHHWAIENSLHWVRDVTLAEDRSTLRVGSTHHVMATLRNLALSLLHLHGFFHIASTLRRFAANPALAIAFVAQPLHVGEQESPVRSRWGRLRNQAHPQMHLGMHDSLCIEIPYRPLDDVRTARRLHNSRNLHSDHYSCSMIFLILQENFPKA